MRLTAPGPPAVPALLPPGGQTAAGRPGRPSSSPIESGYPAASARTTATGPAAARVPPNCPSQPTAGWIVRRKTLTRQPWSPRASVRTSQARKNISCWVGPVTRGMASHLACWWPCDDWTPPKRVAPSPGCAQAPGAGADLARRATVPSPEAFADSCHACEVLLDAGALIPGSARPQPANGRSPSEYRSAV